MLLLDEPTVGFDKQSIHSAWDLIKNDCKGRTVVMSTQFMDEAEYLADQVAIIAQGQLKCLGTPAQLKDIFGKISFLLVVVT